jgi:hypothetical protein
LHAGGAGRLPRLMCRGAFASLSATDGKQGFFDQGHITYKVLDFE